jgi:sugar transferase (PEP-CTERM/EpsH1 system associated)
VAQSQEDFAPLVAHIVFRFDYGGLENGVVNVINRIPEEQYRHVVIALTEATEFADRLREGVTVRTIGKRPGKDFGAYVRLYRLLREIRPDVVHTRNAGTMDCALVAFLAGVPVRIHGEHGWDKFDPDGTRLKYRWFRRALAPFVTRFVTVSDDLRRWLIGNVKVRAEKVLHICNGVDIERFQPRHSEHKAVLPARLTRDAGVVVGSVTRFSEIKDPLNLVEAFIAIRSRHRAGEPNLNLVMIGDGDLLEAARSRIRDAGLDDVCWLPGSRDDIPKLLRAMDIFVLGSLREGISNTVLEAMASALPVIATRTGGNPELVQSGENGLLVASGDSDELARAILDYVHNEKRRLDHGTASRDRVISAFSIQRMVGAYRDLYNHELAEKGH